MSEIVNSSIKKAAKETTLVFLGMAASLLIGFVIKLIIVRNTTVEEFGIYSLAVGVVTLISVISCLGLQEGAPRYVSIFLGEGKEEEAEAISRSAFFIAALTGLTSFVLLFCLSGYLSRSIFYKPEISGTLKIISFFIPFYAMTQVLSGVLRGRSIIMPKVYLLDIGLPLCFLGLIIIFSSLRHSFISIIYAYIISISIIFCLIIIYAHKKIGFTPFPLNNLQHIKKVLHLSIPILIASIMVMMFNWVDTLMLGRYTSSGNVGIYGISVSLANLLTFPINAFGFVFIPMAGEMLAKNQLQELKRTYQVLTKWIFWATFPIFFLLFLFPEMIISFLFGSRFFNAAVPLRILCLGFLLQSFLGVSGHLMVVKGYSKALLQVSFLGAAVNLILNYVLIKHVQLGPVGASLATMLSYSVSTTACALIIYKKTTIHALTSGHLKPVIGASLIGLAIYVIAKSLPLHVLMLPLYLSLFLLGYIVTLLFTRSIEREDIELFEAISKRTGFEMRMIRNIMHRASDR